MGKLRGQSDGIGGNQTPWRIRNPQKDGEGKQNPWEGLRRIRRISRIHRIDQGIEASGGKWSLWEGSGREVGSMEEIKKSGSMLGLWEGSGN